MERVIILNYHFMNDMKAPIVTVLADDLPLFLDGLNELLQKEPLLHIAGTAHNGQELVHMVEVLRPEVVITDIQMPVLNGIEATAEISRRFPEVGVIGLTMYEDGHLIVEAMEAGARGYLLKSSTVAEILDAVQAVSRGQCYFSNSTSMALSKQIALSKASALKRNEMEQLSPKELEIIYLICQEYASKEIAPLTNLSEHTVTSYRKSIMEKTGSRNLAGIVIYAIRNGIYKV
jgi:DNA-binding NarL/FixJ family response regulator